MTHGPLILVTLLLFFVAAITHPWRARCVDGFHADGIRPGGYFECARPFGCSDAQGQHGGWTSTCAGEDRYGGLLYCTGGKRPILNADGCTIGCQLGGWSP